jgi:MoaA/NifB/PqqE/SkfB family radical SAM enzyme
VPVTSDELPFEVSTDQAITLIENIAASDVYQLAFAGGEPLLRPDMLDLATHARSLGLTVQISTNASHDKVPAAAHIRNAGFQCIQVSLDGANSKSHDRVRGAGSFAKVLSFLNDCRSADLPIIVAVSVTSSNVRELVGIRRLCDEYSVGVIKIQPVIRWGDGTFRQDEAGRTSISGNALEPFVQDVFVGSQTQIVFSDQSMTDVPGLYSTKCNLDLQCGVIWEDGSVGACDFDRSNTFGNAFKQPFHDIWKQVSQHSRDTPRCGCHVKGVDR